MKNLKKLFKDKEEFRLRDNKGFAEYDVRKEKEAPKPEYVSGNYDRDIAYMKSRFKYPLNNDIIIREIKLKNSKRAFVIFYDGMCDSAQIDLSVIGTLLRLPYLQNESEENEIAERFIAHSQVSSSQSFDDICDEINFGSCAVIVEGINTAFIIDVRNWGHRGIEKPETEQSIYGPQEAFAEMLRNNTALVRKILKTEKLIAEGIKIGTVSKTRGVMLYISDVANEGLVREVRRRLNGISMEYVISVEEVAMMTEDKTYFPIAQIMSTERPDRAARALSEGRVVLILNGNPRALIFPTTLLDMTHSVSEDFLRTPYAGLTRVIRYISILISILLPGLYIASILFHHEMIPTFLIYSISASRENVPFPSILELLLMDVSFEMIREAGIRMPSPLGSALGIVGGLILGQAAVSAKIVSPIMIIIIAITGIGSFATPDYMLSWANRIMRFVFILLGALLGLYGIAAGVVLFGLYMAAQTNFGIPFISPMPEIKNRSMADFMFTNAVWKKQNRPDFLKTKNNSEEPEISRQWDIE